MAVLTLVKPRILGARNRWKRSAERKTAITRDLIMLAFAVIVAKGIYDGVLWFLNFLSTQATLAFLPPVIPLGLVFSFLFAMLLFSNTVAAFGTLYLSKDNDLILASPLPGGHFFFGKMVEIFAQSSWMAMIFGAPVLLAFGHAYGQGGWFFTNAILITIPLFVIPSALALILVTVFASVVSAARTKELFLVATALVLLGLALIGRILILAGTSLKSDVNDFLKVLNTFAVANTVWSPPYWVSMFLSEQLQPNGRDLAPYALTLVALAISLTALAYCTVRLLHFRGYSRSQAGRANASAYRRSLHRWTERLLHYLPSQFRALLVKDFCIITRDISQGTQLLLLLGISFICLYNFSLLTSVGASLNDAALEWWSQFMIGTSLALGAFVVSAACTRFVFPSLSLEGQSFWLLQTSPLSMRQILLTKVFYWLPPLGLLGLLMFWAGAVVIQAPAPIIIMNILTGLVMSYGIVGLGVGLGAYFANFDWEHASQLIASFGSLVFMLCSVFLIAVNTTVALSISLLRGRHMVAMTLDEGSWYLILIAAVAVMLAINHLVVRISLRLGEKALTDRMRR